ncbi:hypothetical protein GCM10010402_57620 [Actinomadura luteofluorescens]|nr:hypothetical protein [Actinomadura glauciflava]
MKKSSGQPWKEFAVGKHDEKKEGDGRWDKPIPPPDRGNPPGGGKHEKGK